MKNEFWFYGIEVFKEKRGEGFGKILLKEMIQLTNKMGIKKIFLKVDEENIVAVNLYKQVGFVQIDIIKNNILMCRCN